MSPSSVLILSLFLILQLASAKILLIGKNVSLSFDDVEANFTPMIKNSDQCGVLYIAEPLDACTDLVNPVIVEEGSKVPAPYVLIIRGGCGFEDKIRNAQKAGYKAAIVYDNEDYGFLISMAGNPSGVTIYGTFVSKATGEVLREYVGRTDLELWLMPSYETSAWSIMAISFISLLAMSAVLATCFFVRRHRVRRRRIQSPNGRDFSRMSINSLRSMPTTVFNGVCDEASTSSSCAICLDDYLLGDKLRILPCRHKFHVRCVDVWLAQRKSFCPICKRDARIVSINRPASEHTPLLSPSSTPTSSFLTLSSPSTTPLQSSYDLPISIRQDSPSPSTSMHSHTVPMHLSHSRSHTSFQNGSYRSSPPIPVSRSSVDLRNAISQRSYTSPRSIHSRYTHTVSPGNASRSWVIGSLSQRERSFRLNEPVRSLSHFASASSLPDC